MHKNEHKNFTAKCQIAYLATAIDIRIYIVIVVKC